MEADGYKRAEYIPEIKDSVDLIQEFIGLGYFTTPHKEGYSVEDMEGLANFIGKEDLKKYADGWCQPGGSNGFHWSTPELVTQFLNQLKKWLQQ